MSFKLGRIDGISGIVLGALGGAPGGGGIAPISIIFNLPLADLGAGAVDTTPTFSAGSPTASFTRATVAWTKLSTGLWAQVASGTARSCYVGANTAVGAYGGYLSEPAGIQLVTPTASIRDMTDAAWTAVNVTAAKDATGIDGVANSATTLTGTAISGSIQQTLVAAASTRTYHCFMRRKTGTGTITLNQGATTLDVTASLNSSTYTRVALSASVLNAAFGITFGTSGDAVEVDFNQFEAGSSPTSPMDAAGAVRNADQLNYAMTSNTVTSGNPETWYCEGAKNAPVAQGAVNSFLIAGTLSFRTITFSAAAGIPRVFHDTAPAIADAASAITAATISKVAFTYGGASVTVFKDGVAGTPQAMGAQAATGGTMNVGWSSGNGSLLGMMKNVKIYNGALSAAEVVTLTT